MPTGGGSRLPAAALAGAQSAAVAALKRAGALILGKTVSTEFAYFAPGPTRNPRNPEHTPGGSSSGSAAAVAAGYCPLALGTQTIGSIVRPAAFCGVVGFKPSYERISRAGVIPLSPSLDHVGFLARDVATAAAAAAVCSADWNPAPVASAPRLAVPTGPYLERAGAEARSHLASWVERLREAGYEVVEVAAFADFEAVVERHRRIVAAEAARVHQHWFEEFGALYAPQTAELITRGRQVGTDQLDRDLAARAVLRAELEEQLARHDADLWLSPSAPGPAPHGLAATGDPVMNLPWTQAGLPALGLPAGTAANGLPMGLQFVGPFGSDERLLAWGVQLEKELGK
jgi:Asp-tRNA(Asn)/Glu-tRNA(Gln) amidotransferase A subunit family amidase